MEYGRKVNKQSSASFTQLRVWQEGHKLVIAVYRLIRELSDDGKYRLSGQLRRCAVSVTSNISEGYGRWSRKEKDQFFSIASGSLTELKNQLLIARDVGYVSDNKFDSLAKRANITHKLLNALRTANKRNSSKV